MRGVERVLLESLTGERGSTDDYSARQRSSRECWRNCRVEVAVLVPSHTAASSTLVVARVTVHERTLSVLLQLLMLLLGEWRKTTCGKGARILRSGRAGRGRRRRGIQFDG
jgi:hypothetical protein